MQWICWVCTKYRTRLYRIRTYAKDKLYNIQGYILIQTRSVEERVFIVCLDNVSILRQGGEDAGEVGTLRLYAQLVGMVGRYLFGAGFLNMLLRKCYNSQGRRCHSFHFTFQSPFLLSVYSIHILSSWDLSLHVSILRGTSILSSSARNTEMNHPPCLYLCVYTKRHNHILQSIPCFFLSITSMIFSFCHCFYLCMIF